MSIIPVSPSHCVTHTEASGELCKLLGFLHQTASGKRGSS